MTDSEYRKEANANSSTQVDALNKCLSNLFDHPNRSLQDAFAILVGMLNEQATSQKKLYDAFEQLYEKNAEKDWNSTSCMQQLEKLTNDYLLLKRTHEGNLHDIGELKEQVKVRASSLGLSFLWGARLLRLSLILRRF